MQKYKFTFTGSNASGFVRYGGVTFPCGESVVTAELQAGWLARLKNHPEFKVEAVKAKTIKE